MLISGVRLSDSVIHIHVSISFQILFPFRLSQNIEQSSLCYAVGPCWLSILYTVVCIFVFSNKFKPGTSTLDMESECPDGDSMDGSSSGARLSSAFSGAHSDLPHNHHSGHRHPDPFGSV